jgi:hypothetical protein
VKPDFYDRVITLTSEALQATVDEDHETALARVRAVIADHGFNGMNLMLTALADWTVQAQSKAAGREIPEAGVRSAAPAWLDDAGKLTTDADGVGDPERWAGQFLAARAAMDHEMTKALALALPSQCGTHIQALVETCAMSVRALEEAS